MGSATVLIVFLPSSSSDFNRALNSSRGRLSKSAAIRTKGSTLASTLGGLPSARASKASTARFSCSIFFASLFFGFRERLGIGTLHARPQAAQRAELQLLHRAFSLANFPRHFLDASLLDEPQHHHTPLFGGQSIHQSKQSGPALHCLKLRAVRHCGFDLFRSVRNILAALALP